MNRMITTAPAFNLREPGLLFIHRSYPQLSTTCAQVIHRLKTLFVSIYNRPRCARELSTAPTTTICFTLTTKTVVLVVWQKPVDKSLSFLIKCWRTLLCVKRLSVDNLCISCGQPVNICG